MVPDTGNAVKTRPRSRQRKARAVRCSPRDPRVVCRTVGIVARTGSPCDRSVGMASVAYYRQEAERARAAAENSQDAETVLRWLRIAKDYENLANSLEAVPETPPPVMHVPM